MRGSSKPRLSAARGKAIINSINLEDGEERFQHIVPLLKRYGAAVVVGCIDEDPVQGMAVTRQRKLDIARRSYELLTRQYGLDPGRPDLRSAGVPARHGATATISARGRKRSRACG